MVHSLIFDTHVILEELFWKNRKAKDIAKKVRALIVYNDRLHMRERVKKQRKFWMYKQKSRDK